MVYTSMDKAVDSLLLMLRSKYGVGTGVSRADLGKMLPRSSELNDKTLRNVVNEAKARGLVVTGGTANDQWVALVAKPSAHSAQQQQQQQYASSSSSASAPQKTTKQAAVAPSKTSPSSPSSSPPRPVDSAAPVQECGAALRFAAPLNSSQRDAYKHAIVKRLAQPGGKQLTISCLSTQDAVLSSVSALVESFRPLVRSLFIVFSAAYGSPLIIMCQTTPPPASCPLIVAPTAAAAEFRRVFGNAVSVIRGGSEQQSEPEQQQEKQYTKPSPAPPAASREDKKKSNNNNNNNNNNNKSKKTEKKSKKKLRQERLEKQKQKQERKKQKQQQQSKHKKSKKSRDEQKAGKNKQPPIASTKKKKLDVTIDVAALRVVAFIKQHYPVVEKVSVRELCVGAWPLFAGHTWKEILPHAEAKGHLTAGFFSAEKGSGWVSITAAGAAAVDAAAGTITTLGDSRDDYHNNNNNNDNNNNVAAAQIVAGEEQQQQQQQQDLPVGTSAQPQHALSPERYLHARRQRGMCVHWRNSFRSNSGNVDDDNEEEESGTMNAATTARVSGCLRRPSKCLYAHEWVCLDCDALCAFGDDARAYLRHLQSVHGVMLLETTQGDGSSVLSIDDTMPQDLAATIAADRLSRMDAELQDEIERQREAHAAERGSGGDETRRRRPREEELLRAEKEQQQQQQQEEEQQGQQPLYVDDLDIYGIPEEPEGEEDEEEEEVVDDEIVSDAEFAPDNDNEDEHNVPQQSVHPPPNAFEDDYLVPTGDVQQEQKQEQKQSAAPPNAFEDYFIPTCVAQQQQQEQEQDQPTARRTFTFVGLTPLSLPPPICLFVDGRPVSSPLPDLRCLFIPPPMVL